MNYKFFLPFEYTIKTVFFNHDMRLENILKFFLKFSLVMVYLNIETSPLIKLPGVGQYSRILFI